MVVEKVSEKPKVETINPGKEQQKSIADMFKVDLCGPIKDQIGKEIEICGPNIEITPCSPLIEPKWCLPTFMENCIPTHCIPTLPTLHPAAMRFTWGSPICGPDLPRFPFICEPCEPAVGSQVPVGHVPTICGPCVPAVGMPINWKPPICIPDITPIPDWEQISNPPKPLLEELSKSINSLKDEIQDIKKRMGNV